MIANQTGTIIFVTLQIMAGLFSVFTFRGGSGDNFPYAGFLDVSQVATLVS